MSRTTRTLLIAAVGWLLIACAIALFNAVSDDDGQLRWTVINVTDQDRSGDAHLLELANGETWMIDGGFKDLWQRTGRPLLAARDIDEINGFVLTHAHRNHFEGMLDLVIEGFDIEQIFFTRPGDETCNTEPWGGGCRVAHVDRMMQEIRKADIPILPATPGTVLVDEDDVRLTILYQFNAAPRPSLADQPKGAWLTVNDTSAVLLLEVGDTRVLFPGDLGRLTGSWLAQHGESLRADLMVVPHHGLATTVPNAFFDKVNAKAVVATMPAQYWPTGRAAQTRKYFEERGVPVYVSGIHGNITVDINDSGYRISTERP